MKKVLSLLLAASGALSSMAQAPSGNIAQSGDSTVPAGPKYTPNYLLPRWVVDINIMGGLLNQNLSSAYTGANYTNTVPGLYNPGKLKFTTGTTFGFDAQLGYFFGHTCNWGIGTGFMYLSQHGTAKLTDFHTEYQATDAAGQVYRQVISGAKVEEALNITNLNIPLVAKYKGRFSRKWGFTADAGLLFNLQLTNSYKTDASFNYEAIIQQSQTPTGTPWVYDNATTPAANDFLITQSHYLSEHPGGNVKAYFEQQRNAGYNVGLGVKPTNTTGSVSYTSGSIGLLLQPSFSYYVSDNVALNFGLFYIYQTFKHDATPGYRLATESMGSYTSVLNNVTKSENHAYGLNVGMRFLFGKLRDTDHDGIPDKMDRCPDVFGLAQFMGCPDSDGDGIEDALDSCISVKGLVQFHGCPDSDGDGIPDKEDACPYQAGPKALNGCPDRDGDGIADKDDACPDKPGLAQFHGCPDTDGDGIPDNEDQCPDKAGDAANHGCPPPPPPPPSIEQVTAPILFDVGKNTIRKFSMPILEEAAKKLKEQPDGYIVVDGYTDNTGKAQFNKKLSVKRANAVKAALVKMGVSPKKIEVIGNGSNNPAADNTTSEGRQKNRRAVMKITIKN